MAEEGKAGDGRVTFSALGQQRAKAMGPFKAAAGIGKSASWFAKRAPIHETQERGTQSRARLKPARKA